MIRLLFCLIVQSWNFFPAINNGEKMLGWTFIWNIFISLDGIDVFYICHFLYVTHILWHTLSVQITQCSSHKDIQIMNPSEYDMKYVVLLDCWTLNGFQGNISFSVFSWAGREPRPATRKVVSCATLAAKWRIILCDKKSVSAVTHYSTILETARSSNFGFLSSNSWESAESLASSAGSSGDL